MRETPLSRSEFPVTGAYAYLNNAGVGPLPLAAGAAVASTSTTCTLGIAGDG